MDLEFTFKNEIFIWISKSWMDIKPSCANRDFSHSVHFAQKVQCVQTKLVPATDNTSLVWSYWLNYSCLVQSCNDRTFQITTSWHFAVSSRRNLPSYATCFLWPRHHQPHHFSHKTLSQLAFPTPFCRVIFFMLTINLEICAVPSVYKPGVPEPKIKQLNAV